MNAPRNVVKHVGKIMSIDSHTFGDASGKGVAAAVYAVVEQPSGTNRGLVTAKSRLAKKGLMIPRLELVAGHMAANLSCDRENIQAPLQLNPEAPTFRPRRDAAVAARYRIQDANIDAD